MTLVVLFFELMMMAKRFKGFCLFFLKRFGFCKIGYLFGEHTDSQLKQ